MSFRGLVQWIVNIIYLMLYTMSNAIHDYEICEKESPLNRPDRAVPKP
jgi:hypothetical protein